MSDGGDGSDILTGKQNVVEQVERLPSISDQLQQFTKNLATAVDDTVHQINELKQKEMKITPEGKTVCRDLKEVINKSFEYTLAINNLTWNAERDERQQHAFEEAAKEEEPNFKPMNQYIQQIKRVLQGAEEKHKAFHESCEGVVARLEKVSDKTQKNAVGEGIKKTASQVVGGMAAGGAMAAGVGTGATVAVTGIGLSLAAGIPTLGIGTIIGLVITGVAAPVVGVGAGTAAAVGTHYVAKHFNERKMLFQNLARCISNLEEQASQLDYVMNKIKALVGTFDDLTQDVEYYKTRPQQESLLESIRLFFTRLQEFHSACSKCTEILKEKSEVLEKAIESVDVEDEEPAESE